MLRGLSLLPPLPLPLPWGAAFWVPNELIAIEGVGLNPKRKEKKKKKRGGAVIIARGY